MKINDVLGVFLDVVWWVVCIDFFVMVGMMDGGAGMVQVGYFFIFFVTMSLLGHWDADDDRCYRNSWCRR